MVNPENKLREEITRLNQIFEEVGLNSIDIINSNTWTEYVSEFTKWYNTSLDDNEEPLLDLKPGTMLTSINSLSLLTRSEWYLTLYGFGDILAVDYFLSLYTGYKTSYSDFPDLNTLLEYGIGKSFYKSYCKTDTVTDITFMPLQEVMGWKIHNVFIGTVQERHKYLLKQRSKFCTSCKKYYPKTSFGVNSFTFDNLFTHCNYCIIENSRTLEGKIKSIYKKQKSSSAIRKHPEPTYNLEWFIKWCSGNEKFISLYNVWTESGFNTKLAPSIDRIKNDIGYTEDNIQVTTWEENYEKEYGNRNKVISMYRVNESNLIHEFENKTEAAKFINVSRSQFNRLLENNIKLATDEISSRGSSIFAGYIWK